MGDRTALYVFQDVCGRTLIMRLLITDKTGNAAVLIRAKAPIIDFREDCKSKLEALESVLPEGYMTAGVAASGLFDWMEVRKEDAEEIEQDS